MKLIQIFLLWVLLTFSSFSENFNEILIQGNSRISNETIELFSKIPKNNVLDETSLNIILKNLYETGYFKDVSVKIKDNKLFIIVLENPIIQTVFIKGVKTKKYSKGIEDLLILKDRSSFNIIDVKKDEISINNFFKNNGYYFVSVKSSIEEIGINKINLTYDINRGEKSKISKISFLGNKKFKDSKLGSIIVSEEYQFWKFLSGKKFLNEGLISLDERLLINFYKNKGYFNIKIESSSANYLGNNNFELIYNIDAGEKYFFSNLNLKIPSDYDISNFEDLQTKFDLLENKPYSLNEIEKILKEIDKIALNKEYEFLNSTVNEVVKDNLISLVFNIEESEKVYVEKINIIGNNVTLEEVIRNNLFVDEGDAFNKLLHAKSINKVKSLNFFKKVESEIINGSDDNMKIINLSVEEKPTGEISAGAGVGTSGGTVSFGVKENNFLGKGIEFTSDLSVSSETVKGILLVENPNYLGTDMLVNFSMESTTTDRLKNYGYKSSKTGLSIGNGFEFYEDLFLRTGISSYIEKIKTDSTASATVKKQKGSFFDTYFNYSFDYDKRNQKYQPSSGYSSKFTQAVPLISESYSLKNSYNYQLYNEFLDNNVASFNFYAASVNSLSNKNVKLSDRVFIPSNKLRGFEQGKVGPIDGSDYVGGNYAAVVNVSTTLPQILPNSQNTEFSIFFDAGNVWGIDYSSSLSDNSAIRSSIGIAVDLFTPIGPLSFSLSEVISKGKNDITESFRFNLGTTF